MRYSFLSHWESLGRNGPHLIELLVLVGLNVCVYVCMCFCGDKLRWTSRLAQGNQRAVQGGPVYEGYTNPIPKPNICFVERTQAERLILKTRHSSTTC